MLDKIEVCINDWAELADEYQHKENRSGLDMCLQLRKNVSPVSVTRSTGLVRSHLWREGGATKEEQGEVADLQKDILRPSAQLEDMQTKLQTKSGRYLGNVDCSILDKNEKYKYVLASTNYFLNYRMLGLVLMFLICWYYCTLTIRDSIYIVNGSRIKGWCYKLLKLSRHA